MAPLSLVGNQEKMARDIPGKAPASPAPNINRTIIKLINPVTAPVRAVSTDQQATMLLKKTLEAIVFVETDLAGQIASPDYGQLSNSL